MSSERVFLVLLSLSLCAVVATEYVRAGALYPGAILTVPRGAPGTTGDFNEDGLADRILWDDHLVPPETRRLMVLLGHGDGTFGAETRFDGGDLGTANRIATGDFNSDGHLDIVVAGHQGREGLVAFLGGGDGTFGPPIPVEGGEESTWVTVGDLNGDGEQDLVTAEYFQHIVGIFLGNGDDSFDPTRRIAVGERPDFVFIGDFDGDENPDIALRTRSARQEVTILRGQEGGNFALEPSLPYGRLQAVRDFSSDGRDDLAVRLDPSASPDILQLFLGNADGSFTPGEQLIISENSFGTNIRTIVGDVNVDGIPDVVASFRDNLDIIFPPDEDADRVLVFLGEGDGTFGEGIRSRVGGSKGSISLTDFNGDALPDLDVNGSDPGGRYMIQGNGDGTFGALPRPKVGAGPYFVATGRIDSNQSDDLVVANGYSNDVSVLLSNGGGRFQPERRLAVGAFPVVHVLGDFSSDGHTDIVEANFDEDTLSFLAGNGDGTFAPAVPQESGLGPSWIVAADFDGSGTLDLAVANLRGNDVSILLGNGAGQFMLNQQVEVGESPFALALGNFNSDHSVDLVVSNSGSDDISVLLGNGDGTFASELRFEAGERPTPIAAGDLNGDGFDDVVVSNNGSNDLFLFLATGDGALEFHSALELDGISGSGFVTIADVNRDSLLDVLRTDFQSNKIDIYLGKGDGTFAPKLRFATGILPTAVAIGDFDGDKLPDLAVSHLGCFRCPATRTELITILLNQSPDEDKDGVPDEFDACLGSDTAPSVVINDCDSRVENLLVDDGCTIADRIAACAVSSVNHGKFQACVGTLGEKLRHADLLTGRDKAALLVCAAFSTRVLAN